MERNKVLEDNIREAACIGDIDTLDWLLKKGVDPNARHNLNGWTPLHWAARRGHKEIVVLLLKHGADKSVLTEKGESAVSLARCSEIRELLGEEPGSAVPPSESSLPITPSYLKNPPINNKVDLSGSGLVVGRRKQNGVNMSNDSAISGGGQGQSSNPHPQSPTNSNAHSEGELVLKVRLANCGDPDFIEVELPQVELTYYTLLRVCCEELGLTTSQVVRIRKLPDTVIRKDKDVQRLANFQEIELVVAGQNGVVTRANGTVFPLNGAANGYQSIHLYKNQTILY